MKILNIGSCNIDWVYHMEHIVRPGETEASVCLETFPGGKGLNQSIALARAGARVLHAGCIGPDGEFLKEWMAASGVDVSLVQTVQERTGHAMIQVEESGQNSIVLFSGANFAITPSYVDAVFDHICAGDWLLLQNEISCLPYILKKAGQANVKVLWNPSPFEEGLRAVDLNGISVLLLNEGEAAAFSGREEPLRFFAKYPQLTVVLTLGEKGCLCSRGGTTVYQPAFLADAVDTTGAGDTFTGYFIAALAEEKPLEEALRNASAAAALAVGKKGASSSIPWAADVAAALGTLQPCAEENEFLQQRKNTAEGSERNRR